jgi:uncharacterized ferritin-like protein (DUF455 family)
MTDPSGISDQMIHALAALEAVADRATPEDASVTFDDAALQVFWRDWPRVSSWAGSLWRLLNEDLARPSSAVRDGDIDEVGGEAG